MKDREADRLGPRVYICRGPHMLLFPLPGLETDFKPIVSAARREHQAQKGIQDRKPSCCQTFTWRQAWLPSRSPLFLPGSHPMASGPWQQWQHPPMWSGIEQALECASWCCDSVGNCHWMPHVSGIEQSQGTMWTNASTAPALWAPLVSKEGLSPGIPALCSITQQLRPGQNGGCWRARLWTSTWFMKDKKKVTCWRGMCG